MLLVAFVTVSAAVAVEKINWRRYQLSDAYSMCERVTDDEMFQTKLKRSKAYPGSIVAEVLAKHSLPGDGEALVETAVRERKDRIDLAEPQSATIHLRIGDVLDEPHLNVEDDVWLHGSSPTIVGTHGNASRFRLAVFNHGTRDFFRRVEERFPNDTRTVYILGYANHSITGWKNHSRSDVYRLQVTKFFEDKGYAVIQRDGDTPDDDLVFMAFSPFVVPTGGSFGTHACNLARLFNGTCVISEDVVDDDVSIDRLAYDIKRLEERVIPIYQRSPDKRTFLEAHVRSLKAELDTLLN